MQIALIADVHANLPALEAVLADIDRRGEAVGTVYHLGDLVGYAPWPNEVVSLVRQRAIAGVSGNYDSTVASGHDHCGCRYEDPREQELSHESYAWTRARVTGATRRYLEGLPFRLDVRPLGGHRPGPRLILIHGAPTLNTLYWSEDRPDEFCLEMAARLGAEEGDTVAFGHTHRPWSREIGGIRFVNAGSVGRPRDGDWRACYVLVEVGGVGAGADFVRVGYDVGRVSDAIRRSGLPGEFAEILETGGLLRP